MAELKNRLSEYLRRVRRGETVTVFDRDTPIARLEPLGAGTEALGEREIAGRREVVYRVLETVEVVEPTQAILSRAAQPVPVTVGALDAIHLATAQTWREARGADLVVATHEERLAASARALGFRCVGV